MAKPADLHDAIAAVCPIAGVRIGDWANKATWGIDFDSSATAQQKTDAQTALTNFDPLAPTRLSVFASDAGAQDLVNRLKTATVAQIDTWLTNNVTNLAQARTVLAAIIKVLALQLRT